MKIQPTDSTDYRACEDGCLIEYFDSYGVANLLPEINKFLEQMFPFTLWVIILSTSKTLVMNSQLHVDIIACILLL